MAAFERPRVRLHIGAGDKPLPGWTNLDRTPGPGIDVVADVRAGLRFENVEAIFAEHFLEHLEPTEALAFLVEAHRVLTPGGVLRLSTPNLDWVWRTCYRLEATDAVKQMAAIQLNLGFHGWGHRFLWNREMLTAALHACGFGELAWWRHGESARAIFRGVERHETYADEPDLPHVIIVEALPAEPRPAELAALTERFRREFVAHLQR